VEVPDFARPGAARARHGGLIIRPSCSPHEGVAARKAGARDRGTRRPADGMMNRVIGTSVGHLYWTACYGEHGPDLRETEVARGNKMLPREI
jgi:hypothetical protein